MGALALAGLVAAVAWPRQEKVAGHAYAIPSGEDRILVEVINGSGRDGLARRITRHLRSRGLDVVYFGTGPAAESTLVIARRGERRPAEQVRGALGQGIVREAADTLRRVDVTVVVGADYVPDQELRP